MKKSAMIILLFVMIAAAGGYVWWQQHKKKIVKDLIQNTIHEKTDSLYAIRYDSSIIDEINGNVSFYNVSLQSDAARKELLAGTDSLPALLFFIKASAVKATGLDVAGIVQNTNVAAHKIIIDHPQIQIIRTGSRSYTVKDTLELYRRILGKFSSIKADTIQIAHGQVIISNRDGSSQSTLEDINVNLSNFLVDSLHSYENIISYFIRDVNVSVENIQFPESKNNTRINITGLQYNARARTLQVKQVRQYKTGNTKPVTELDNISISKLNTDAFILQQQLKGGMINCEGGLITIYKKQKNGQPGNNRVEFSTDLDAVEIEGASLGKTRVVIIDETNPSAAPLVLEDVYFNMTQGLKVSGGNTLTDIITGANWKLTSSGFSVFTADHSYHIDVKGIAVDNTSSGISADRIAIMPVLSEKAFVQQSLHQRDRYEMVFTNISLKEVDFKKLITDNTLEAGSAGLQADVKIFNDRTVPADMASKVGKAPYQMIMKLKMPLFIGRLQLRNSLVEYTERGAESAMKGTVSFKNINGTVTNITNIGERIKQNGIMTLSASAKFLGAADISTVWQMPLTEGNGGFTVNGTLGAMNAKALNPLIEPLGMASVTSGSLKKTVIALNGNDYQASGSILFTYNDLKIEILKKGLADERKTKGISTFLANTILQNDNPSNGGAVRMNEVQNTRELNKSFFNLLWKTIYKGVKKTATGKRS